MSRSLSVCLSLAALVAVCRFPAAAVQRNEEAIAAVRAGKVKVARASWWGFDPEDATAALQAAINSGARTLVVENMGRPWIVTPIRLASNQTIVFERGAEVLARKGAFLGTGDCLFSATGKENIRLVGYGALLRMRRWDYARPPYPKAEWRHVLEFTSCRNVGVYGLTLADSGGDGIYLGTGTRGVSNVNVHIRDVLCDRNYRQGISVITADGLLIENTTMRHTAGTPPMAGIDFEPNEPAERLCNVVMRNCVTEGNSGCGYAIYIPTLNGSSAPVSMLFDRCKAIGDGYAGLALTTGNSPVAAVKGRIEFRDCVFQGSRASGVLLSDKPYNGCRVRFERCSILDVAAKDPLQSPIQLLASQTAGEPIGGIEFVGCLVRDTLDRKPMTYQDSTGGLDLKGVRGSLTLSGRGRRTRVTLTRQVLGEWMPVLALKALPRRRLTDFRFSPPASLRDGSVLAPGFARLRERARAVLYAGQGDRVTLRLYYGQVGRYAGNRLPVVVLSPGGQEVARVEAAFMAETELAFTAPEVGLYRIQADPGLNSLAFVSSSHPLSLSGDGEPVHLVSSQGVLYFWVPAGTREFAVRVIGEGAEGMRASLFDASGKLVEEKDDVGALHQFLVELPRPSAGEAWSLRLSNATHLFPEDFHVDLRELPPLLAGSREALLTAVAK